MNKRECAIITAYTGVSFGGKLFSEFHQYVQEKFGRPIYTHEMAAKLFWSELKRLSEDDFVNLAENIGE